MAAVEQQQQTGAEAKAAGQATPDPKGGKPEATEAKPKAAPKSNKKNSGKSAAKASAKATPRATKSDLPTSEKGLRDLMASNEEGYKAYQAERAKGTSRADNPHREAYSTYKRAYGALLAKGKGVKGSKREVNRTQASA